MHSSICIMEEELDCDWFVVDDVWWVNIYKIKVLFQRNDKHECYASFVSQS